MGIAARIVILSTIMLIQGAILCRFALANGLEQQFSTAAQQY